MCRPAEYRHTKMRTNKTAPPLPTAASAPRLSSVKAEIIAYRIARRNDRPRSCSTSVNAGLQPRVWSTPRCNHIGVSSSGKTQHFDCCIRWFKSSYPCHAERRVHNQTIPAKHCRGNLCEVSVWQSLIQMRN